MSEQEAIMALDVWGKLWDIATSEAGEPATIHPDPEDSGEVMLVWPDGSRSALYWHEGGWRHHEQLDTCPCDVAARDSF